MSSPTTENDIEGFNVFDLELLSLTPPGWGATLASGFINSVLLAAGGYAVGLAIGISGAMGKLYGGLALREVLNDYTTVVRAVPELVLILLLYYAGTDAINRLLTWMGAGSISINGIAAGIAVIGIVQGAYATEVIRAAILAIPAGQVEAARAFGMPPLMVLWRVVLPAMLPFALPGLGNLWLVATKDTALLAVVGFEELTLATRQAAGSTKAYLLFFSAAALIYLALTMLSTGLLKLLEKRASRGLMVTYG